MICDLMNCTLSERRTPQTSEALQIKITRNTLYLGLLVLSIKLTEILRKRSSLI